LGLYSFNQYALIETPPHAYALTKNEKAYRTLLVLKGKIQNKIMSLVSTMCGLLRPLGVVGKPKQVIVRIRIETGLPYLWSYICDSDHDGIWEKMHG
jgi:hypothetical protein